MLKTEIINPELLEIDATIPQCLDNQFVSDKVFMYMINNKLDYTNNTVKKLREQDFKIEFIRSLIYSSQIVINRAFLTNSEFLYKNYLPINEENLLAFSKLMNDNIIVPYLYKNGSLDEDLEFDTKIEGHIATQELFNHLDTITCVRLSQNDQKNDELILQLEQNFRSYLVSLKHKDELQYNYMTSNLFTNFNTEMWKRFKKSLIDLSTFAFNEEKLTRNIVYKKFFVQNDKPSEGKFRKPSKDNPFIFEIKKLVDLKYNTNLPDILKIYTFTPSNLPDRITLQDWNPNDTSSSINSDIINSKIDDLFLAKHNFIANTQKAINLPLLSDLTVSDVLEIRKFDEWTEFINMQKKMLDNPEDIVELLSEFQNKFQNLQKALSIWYNYKYKRKKTEKLYSHFVTVALAFASNTLLFGLNQEGLIESLVENFSATAIISKLSKEKYQGFAVKLMLNVIDIGKMQIDKQLSSSLDIMKSNQEYSKEEIIDLINRFKNMKGDSVKKIGKVADMGAK